MATAPSLVNADDNEHWDVPVGFSSVCLHLKLRTSHQHQESVMDMCCVCKERIAETNSENSNHFFLQVCSPLMAFSLCVSSLVMSALRGLVARPELSSAFVNSNHTSSWPCCYRFPSKMSLRESAFCAHQCALLYSHRYQQKPRFNEVCVNSTPIITL